MSIFVTEENLINIHKLRKFLFLLEDVTYGSEVIK